MLQSCTPLKAWSLGCHTSFLDVACVSGSFFLKGSITYQTGTIKARQRMSHFKRVATWSKLFNIESIKSHFPQEQTENK